MTLYSQLDPRWKNELLGFSSVTIGGYGCTITSIGMLLDETPSSVNARMKAVGGFADKNLVIWEKIKDAFPEKVESVRRVWYYDNEDVKANIPCIVQVNGAPIGASMHFVVYVGDHKIYDPWGGVERPTAYYDAQSYCVIKLKPQIQIPQQPTMNDQDKKDIESMHKLREYNGVWYEAKNIIDDFEKEKADRRAEVEALNAKIDRLSTDNLILLDDLETEKKHAKLTLESELSKQRSEMLMACATEKKDLVDQYETKLKDAQKENPVEIVEKETALSVRFQHKPIKERIKAIVDILLA